MKNSTIVGLFIAVVVLAGVFIAHAGIINPISNSVLGPNSGFATSTVTANCGPVKGSDNSGAVTFATSSANCTITFSTPWNNVPSCVWTNATSSANIIRSQIITTTTDEFLDTSNFPTSSVDDYHCFGNPN